jgi:hypothetical protein
MPNPLTTTDYTEYLMLRELRDEDPDFFHAMGMRVPRLVKAAEAKREQHVDVDTEEAA